MIPLHICPLLILRLRGKVVACDDGRYAVRGFRVLKHIYGMDAQDSMSSAWLSAWDHGM